MFSTPQYQINGESQSQVELLQRFYLEFLKTQNYENSNLLKLRDCTEDLKFVFLTTENMINPISFLTQLQFNDFRFTIDILSASTPVFEWRGGEINCTFNKEKYFINKGSTSTLIVPHNERNVSTSKYSFLGSIETMDLTKKIFDSFLEYILNADYISRLNRK